MAEGHSKTYEQLKTFVGDLEPASAEDVREIGFADNTRTIALSRNHECRVELVLSCDRLKATRPIVDLAMDYNPNWKSLNEGSFPANRIVFPSDMFFDSAAAMICVELIEAGFAEDPANAFAAVEPLIEKFIAGGNMIGDHKLIGLYGELTLLDAMTAHADPADTGRLVDSWFGWRPSSRDFQLGQVGIEVKTTTGSTSRHHIQGFHQIEVGHPVTDVAETSLQLLSIGLIAIPEDQDTGQSLPSLVEQIRQRLPTGSVQDAFLDRVQEYGGDAGAGYNHSRDQAKARFETRFVPAFERLYDLTDDALHILGRPDVSPFTHVEADSIEFNLNLPFPFRGAANPVSGLGAIVSVLTNSTSETSR